MISAFSSCQAKTRLCGGYWSRGLSCECQHVGWHHQGLQGGILVRQGRSPGCSQPGHFLTAPPQPSPHLGSRTKPKPEITEKTRSWDFIACHAAEQGFNRTLLPRGSKVTWKSLGRVQVSDPVQSMEFSRPEYWASLMALWWSSHLPVQEMWVQSLGGEEPVEKELAARSSILAWRTPCTGEPGGLQSLVLHSRTSPSN